MARPLRGFSVARLLAFWPLTSRRLESIYQCLIQSRSTILVSAALSASGPARQTCLRWCLGMVVKPGKSHLRLAQKTVWDVSAAKPLVRLTSLASGCTLEQKRPVVWGWLTSLSAGCLINVDIAKGEFYSPFILRIFCAKLGICLTLA
jgi:hypothetical protein